MQPQTFGRTNSSRIFNLFFTLLMAGLAASANAQSACTVGSGVNTLVRAEGYNDLVGDIVFTCTGGTPTAPGVIVNQVDFLVTLNGTITSRITATLGGGTGANMTEALLLMDDPNSTKWNNTTPHPLANCGLHGEDSGPSGPGVCAIVSDGTPADTYNGALLQGGAACTTLTAYGCGHPNVFQGRVAVGGFSNTIQFLGIPYDPPVAGQTRTIRIVNLRVNGNGYGVASPFTTVPVIATISLSNNSSLSLTNTSVQVGQVEQGLISQVTSGSFMQCSSTATSTGDATNPFYSAGMKIRVLENFATAFKVKNIRQILDNGTLSGTNYVYNGGTAYNQDYDQNVPGAVYGTETGFYFPPTGSSLAPGAAEPPAGFGAPVSGGNIGSRFTNGGTSTGIGAAGFANQGTRIAVTMDPPPAGSSAFVPIVVALKNQANNAQTGIMVLTDTDSSGAGVFSQSAAANLPSPVTAAANAAWAPLPANNIAVYEVLFSDPNSQEYADIVPSLVYTSATNTPALGSVSAAVDFAPTYIPATGANLPSATLAEPRFAGTGALSVLYSIASCSGPPPQVAAPTFSVPGGSYSTTQQVSLSTTTAGASIRYTTDGVTTPTETIGTLYVSGNPITVSSTTTIKAIAYASGMTDSTVSTATYTINVASGNGATFVRVDSTTKGSWKGVYGTSGYNVINDTISYPAFVTVTPAGQASYTWSPSTGDARALQKEESTTDRIAATWYTSGSYTIDLNFNDGAQHQVRFTVWIGIVRGGPRTSACWMARRTRCWTHVAPPASKADSIWFGM